MYTPYKMLTTFGLQYILIKIRPYTCYYIIGSYAPLEYYNLGYTHFNVKKWVG